MDFIISIRNNNSIKVNSKSFPLLAKEGNSKKIIKIIRI